MSDLHPKLQEVAEALPDNLETAVANNTLTTKAAAAKVLRYGIAAHRARQNCNGGPDAFQVPQPDRQARLMHAEAAGKLLWVAIYEYDQALNGKDPG